MTSVAAKLAPGGGLGAVAVLMAVEIVACVAVGLVFYALIERTFMIRDWPQRLGRAFATHTRLERRHNAAAPSFSRLREKVAPRSGVG